MIPAIILGIIQGITEFLPISSSGHLLVIPHLLGWDESGLAFDVALNTGTFLAVLVYFWRTYWDLLYKGIVKRDPEQLSLMGLLVLATVPAAIIGLISKNVIESSLRQPTIAAVMLILFAGVLWYAEKIGRQTKDIGHIGWKTALGVGVFQALALVPGVSRSGITMTAGLFAGMTREAAARFSFLLIAPISLAAAVLEAKSVLAATNKAEIAIGTLVSFIVGLLAMHVLMRLVKKYGFKPYVWYRVIVGLVFLVLIVR